MNLTKKEVEKIVDSLPFTDSPYVVFKNCGGMYVWDLLEEGDYDIISISVSRGEQYNINDVMSFNHEIKIMLEETYERI